MPVFSHTAIVPVHENLILIAYAIIPKVISIILLLVTNMFSDIFSLAIYKDRSYFWPKSIRFMQDQHGLCR